VKSLVVLLLSSDLIIPGRLSAEDDSKPRTFDSKGVPIRYTVEGRGEPVVLIHGLYASAQFNWRAPGTVRTLAEDYQVLALDVRGHGGSGKPKEDEAYGIEMMEDIVRLLDHLKIEKAHMAGYSMGGMIILKLLTRHPDRVRSAILGGMGWLRQGSPPQQFWTQLPERQRATTPAACARSLGALAMTEDEVKAIRVPVTVLVGERDPCRPLYVSPLEQIRPDWPVKEIPGAGHVNCIFQPEFKKGIKDWLDQQARH
jgi:pimeloyl-ACP methyl ester carboxylesterase